MKLAIAITFGAASIGVSEGFECTGASDAKIQRCTVLKGILDSLGEASWGSEWNSCVGEKQNFDPCNWNSNDLSAGCSANWFTVTCGGVAGNWEAIKSVKFQSAGAGASATIADATTFKDSVVAFLENNDNLKVVDANVVVDFSNIPALNSFDQTCISQCGGKCVFPFSSVQNEVAEMDWATFSSEDKTFDKGFDVCATYTPPTASPTAAPTEKHLFDCSGASADKKEVCEAFAQFTAALGEEDWKSCTSGKSDPCTINEQSNCSPDDGAVIQVGCINGEIDSIFVSKNSNGVSVKSLEEFHDTLQNLLTVSSSFTIDTFSLDELDSLKATCIPECEGGRCYFPFTSIMNEVPENLWENFTSSDLNELFGADPYFDKGFVNCQPFIPTSSPTEAPSKAPSSAPSKAPTQRPSEFPTAAPVTKTTQKPTSRPTSRPSSAPIASSPTPDPTMQATDPPVADKPTNSTPTSAPTPSDGTITGSSLALFAVMVSAFFAF